MCMLPSCQVGSWLYVGPGEQFREITHSAGDLWINAQGLECLYVTCVCGCVCVCMQGNTFKRTFISSSDIITPPRGRRQLYSSPSFWPDLSNPIFHPSSFLFYLALFLSFFTDPGKSQSNPSPLQLGKPWWVLVTPTECSSSMGHPFSASSHSSRSNQPGSQEVHLGEITPRFSPLNPKRI